MTAPSDFTAHIKFLDDCWFSWCDLQTRFAQQEFLGSGVYVVANFEIEKPVGVDPTDSRVVYIGETHGSRTNLKKRLEQFAKSAGF